MSDSRGDWPSQIGQAWELSPSAIELSVLSEDEIDGLANYLADDPPLPFRYVSIHGPSKGRSIPESTLVDVLVKLSVRADAIVMHPDTIDDLVGLSSFGKKAAAREHGHT